ncbi:Uncharacterised protein [Mycobacteroides abscessus subsp. abscessus]|nr:Uncharacterised protein [Mycobacteroides abscessus subsp. abscessus]
MGSVRDDRMHRIGRREPQRPAARTAEGLQELLQYLIGTVCRPDILGHDRHTRLLREIGGQIRT